MNHGYERPMVSIYGVSKYLNEACKDWCVPVSSVMYRYRKIGESLRDALAHFGVVEGEHYDRIIKLPVRAEQEELDPAIKKSIRSRVNMIYEVLDRMDIEMDEAILDLLDEIQEAVTD